MRGVAKRVAAWFCLLFLVAGGSCAAVSAVEIAPQFTAEEQAFIAQSQGSAPVQLGIIPHNFPFSDCPPDAPAYVGIHVEMLEKISQVSGLQFEYCRIPIEEKTPYQVLEDGTVSLVVGTIRLESFVNNPKLILSQRFSDGSAGCIAMRGTNPVTPQTGVIAVMKGYQAGAEFGQSMFPDYRLQAYPSNQEALRAVRKGQADLAIINRYVGIYQLQNPLNENLEELSLYKQELDSCIMGVNTPENQTLISIINKSLATIGEDGYNYIQMNFTLSNPYRPTTGELFYKYRYILMVIGITAVGISLLTVRLLYTQREHRRLSLDPLTGAYSEAGFELAAAKILPKASQPLFITDFDIYRFSSYNELNGKARGDELLRDMVKIVKSFLSEQDVICRSYADHFKVLSSKCSLEALIADIHRSAEQFNRVAQSTIAVNFGVYPVTDATVPITKMLDFAAMAKKSIKEHSNVYVGVFDETLLKRYVSEAKMTSAFQGALENKEFVAYYQPKFDAAKQTVIGAEALVRWVTGDGVLVPPGQFIELFEKSGQIQQLDFYMLKRVCLLLQDLMAQGRPVLPIAVNFSRVHLYSEEFVKDVVRIVEEHGIPKHLIEIECTETTMLNNIELTRALLGALQAQGFSIAMDDFGSAYSSLNTLCSIPLDVLKLDSGFLMATLSHEKKKSEIIISSVIALAHDLSLKVVAEGVETQEQYQFLKGLGCDFIQGYYFSRPLEEQRFLELLAHM